MMDYDCDGLVSNGYWKSIVGNLLFTENYINQI